MVNLVNGEKPGAAYYVVVAILTVLALGGLFVVPLTVAANPEGADKFEVISSCFSFSLAIFVGLIWMSDILGFIYGVRRPYFKGGKAGPWIRLNEPNTSSLRAAILGSLVVFLLTIWGFAVIFLVLSSRDSSAFSKGRINIFSALYFSFLTATTVGCGDPVPISGLARFFAVMEVLFGLFFLSSIFSVIAAGASRFSSREPR